MIRIILFILLLIFGVNGFAQSEKYTNNQKDQIIRLRCCGTPSPDKQALLIINGKAYEMKYMGGFNPNVVQDINVFNGADAIKKYGPKAKNGVIVITTHKNTKWQSITAVLRKSKINKNDLKLPIVYNGNILQSPYLITQKHLNYIAYTANVVNFKLNREEISGRYLFINETK